jgi:phage-related protein
MLDFLAQVANLITGDIKAVKNWILSIIQAVYSFIDREISAIGTEVHDVWSQLYGFITTVEHYVISVYNYVVNGLNIVYHDITSWVSGELAALGNWITGVVHDILAGLDYVKNAIVKAYDDIEHWVMQHIWDPLWAAITQAWNWITHEGAFIYGLVTHPERLAALLGHYLWSSYLGLIKRYAKPIAHWLLHTMLSLAGDVADVLETIITALI